MVSKEMLDLIDTLERQELENAAADVAVPVLTYTKLLAFYLYQNDLCNAKFLWKRIPAKIKTTSTSTELQNVWKVGQKMWLRDFPGTYMALNVEWSSDIAEIMENIKVKLRQRAVSLVATAYSSISLDTLAQFTGISAKEAEQEAVAAGWDVDSETGMVRPVKPAPAPVQPVSCEEQLAKLTEFVAFLEN